MTVPLRKSSVPNFRNASSSMRDSMLNMPPRLVRSFCFAALAPLVGCVRTPGPASAPSVAVPAPAAVEPVVYTDATRPLEVRVQDLIKRLTLAEKASLLIDKAQAVERLGIPAYDAWNEALHGVSW